MSIKTAPPPTNGSIYLSIEPFFNSNEEELLKIMKRVYEDSYGYLTDMQYNFRKCVDFIYNLNGNEELRECKPSSKFIAFLVTHHNDIYLYSSDIEVILDTNSFSFSSNLTCFSILR